MWIWRVALMFGLMQAAAAQNCGCRAFYDAALSRAADDMVKCNVAANGKTANCAVIGSPVQELSIYVQCYSDTGAAGVAKLAITAGSAKRYFLNVASVDGQVTFTSLQGSALAISQEQGRITSIDSDVNSGTLMNVKTSIAVDPRDIGKAGKTFFVFYYESVGAKTPFSGLWAYFTRPTGGYDWIWWSLPTGQLPDTAEPRIYNTPHDPANAACTFPCLPTLRSYNALPTTVEVNLPVTFFPYYDDKSPTLKIPVIYELYLGYVTADGFMVINPFQDERSIYRFQLTPTLARAGRSGLPLNPAPNPGPGR